ncbi:MAG: DUF3332 domain-containing protein [Clostridium sp.]|nr:DUF3332 domain-containing protein [Clostridium sp.]
MRKIILPALCAAIIASMTLSSCIGSFSLTNRLLDWNRQVDSKFVNEVVFFAFWILPVYEVSALADLLVLNSIEFWSGNKPVAQGRSVVEGNDGLYIVDCDGRGYTITSETDGSVVRLDFDDETRSWSYSTPAMDEPVVFMTYVDDTHISVPADADGSWRTVDLAAAGRQWADAR